MQLLRNPGWLLGCCNAVARVSGSVARMLLCGLLGYPGWLLLGSMVLGVVAKVLLCGCYGTQGGC